MVGSRGLSLEIRVHDSGQIELAIAVRCRRL
jgi:hypothetical protein